MIVTLVFGLLLVGTFVGLNIYTRHNESISVPNVKGLRVKDAATFLASSGLKYEVVDSVFKRGGTPGAVLEQIPKASSQVKSGRTVFLTVQATGQQMVTMPDLNDYSQRQAVSLLESLGFADVQIVPVASEYKDLVISLEYKGATVSKGQKIPQGALLRLYVGNGLGSASTDSTEAEGQVKVNSDESFF